MPESSEPVRGFPASSPGPESTAPVPPKRTTGLAAAVAEEFSVKDAIGGPRGVAESVLPSLIYLVMFVTTQQLRPALIWSVGVAAVLTVLRLITRSSPMQAISGLIGVAFCAWLAHKTGQARDYYVTGFWINVGMIALSLISLLPLPALTIAGVRRRAGSYPLIGLFIGFILGEGLHWRDVPRRHAAYRTATLLFLALYVLRLVVQVPFYLANNVEALGISRLVMGFPAYAAVIWFCWLILRAVPVVKPGE